MSTNLNSKGFTLIELMLAMALFISVMLVATVGFVGINRTFSKGLVRKALSEGVQRTVEDMTNTIRSSGTTLEAFPGTDNTLCSEAICYVWGNNLGEGGGLYKTLKDSDAVSETSYTKGVELLDQRFFIRDLDTIPISSELYRVIGIVHSNQDGVVTDISDEGEPSDYVCKGSTQEGASRNCALEKFEFVVSTAIKGPESGDN